MATVSLFAFATGAPAADTLNFSHLVRSHKASVVNISTLPRVQPTPSFDSPTSAPDSAAPDPALRPFDDTTESDGSSLGSGLLVSNDGYILTCAHVVEEAREIVVRLIDRREFSARLVGTDTRTDVALLKIDASGLPAVAIGDPDKLEVGEWVLAIGSPFGFQHSVTAGIVSAKGRSLPNESYTPFIQTDVAINPGNSGGPLFNLRGEVVGVNSQIYSRSGGFMGVSFAIPIDLAMRVAEQLKREGRLRRGWLGVSPQEVTRGLASAYSLDKPKGALIADILPDSPAARSELRPGDIVLDYAGKSIESSADLPLLVAQTLPRTRVNLRVQRRGSAPRDMDITVGELRDEPLATPAPDMRRPHWVLEELTERQKRQENISHGVMVEGVDVKVRQAGLRPGDIVIELDGRQVQSVSEFQRLLARIPNQTYAVLRIRRGAQALYVAFMPGN